MFKLNLPLTASQIIAFNADGSQITVGEWQPKLQALVVQLQAHRAQRWLLNVQQPLDFLTALLALWHTGKTPVLLPNNAAGTVAQMSAHFDVVLSAPECSLTGKYQQLILPMTPTANIELPLPAISENVGVYFYTSGSTGTPKKEHKTWPQLLAEISQLERTFGTNMASQPVYASVPCQHIYGFLFRLLWPWLSLRPFANFELEYPEQLTHISQPYIFITSPALLKRLAQIEPCQTTPSHVFSSGGALSLAGAHLCQQQLQQDAIEVLGSTETGGVAWRQQRRNSLWRRFDNVDISLNCDGFLQVRSPYFSANSVTMGDTAKLIDQDHFELLGRGDRIVKVEEKRISLVAIEQHLMTHPWIEEACACALELTHRQAIGCALVLTASGQQALKTQGKRALSQIFNHSISPYIEAIARPKKYRYLASLPYNSQGKLTHAALQEVFHD
ncbi:class I adenylate-forming enzyme family protein [Motilimonas sp. E26]|uniref:AMP-binding protein n=1 Tax=Motilimonas sp. E26 TaxID=2865674 RepID=UPI001E429739|nr:class I adenylate-forming enzyme family protein [Motilimonas sp. E26]MCE0556462.1 acyl--CoA ligase [Motilimonas sp. E26]